MKSIVINLSTASEKLPDYLYHLNVQMHILLVVRCDLQPQHFHENKDLIHRSNKACNILLSPVTAYLSLGESLIL